MKTKAIVAPILSALIAVTGAFAPVTVVAGTSSGVTAADVRLPRLPLPPKPKIKKPRLPGTGAARGPEVPVPLTSAMPFPWTQIEGIWQAEYNDQALLFSFEVQVDYNDRQYLRVVQLNAFDGSVVSEGVGISMENDTLVRAAMTGPFGTYMLFVGAYKDPNSRSRTKSVTVLTIRSFEDVTGKDDMHLVTTKMSSVPYTERSCQSK